MRRIENIFLDDGGVLNDNRLRAPQWQQLVAEFFAPRLGGSHQNWADANRRVIGDVLGRLEDRLSAWERDGFDYLEVVEFCDLEWLESMCESVGVEPPIKAADRVNLSREASASIMPRVSAAFPGAVEATREIARRFRLFTASGGTSTELGYTLEGMGIRDCFLALYGPDLVNTPKLSTGYYRRIFADATVDPAVTLVVDDKPEMLAYAREAGAATALVTDSVAGFGADFVVPLLRDLLPMIGPISR